MYRDPADAAGLFMNKTCKKILCIEDDHETAAFIAEELIDRGFDVHVAYDGKEGYAAILKLAPDLVLSDIVMPGASGFDVLIRITALAPRFRDMPFVFLTAATDRDTERKAWQLGADGFITKPIDFDILEAMIAARLAWTRNEPCEKTIKMSDRELETLGWAARGKTSAEIAIIMKLSKRTVDFHLDNARIKLGATTRIEAVVKAATIGLIHL